MDAQTERELMALLGEIITRLKNIEEQVATKPRRGRKKKEETEPAPTLVTEPNVQNSPPQTQPETPAQPVQPEPEPEPAIIQPAPPLSSPHSCVTFLQPGTQVPALNDRERQVVNAFGIRIGTTNIVFDAAKTLIVDNVYMTAEFMAEVAKRFDEDIPPATIAADLNVSEPAVMSALLLQKRIA